MGDYVMKLCLLGDAGVGKTSLVYRFIENRFSRDFKSTLGVNLLKKSVSLETDNISAQIWDLGGQEAYRKLRQLYLEGSQGALLVFDLTSKSSFENLNDWVASIRKSKAPDIPFVLIGNKLDLKENRVVSPEAAKAFADKNKMSLILTSAATGEGVEAGFVDLIKVVLSKIRKVPPKK